MKREREGDRQTDRQTDRQRKIKRESDKGVYIYLIRESVRLCRCVHVAYLRACVWMG